MGNRINDIVEKYFYLEEKCLIFLDSDHLWQGLQVEIYAKMHEITYALQNCFPWLLLPLHRWTCFSAVTNDLGFFQPFFGVWTVYAGRLHVRSFVRSISVRASVTECTIVYNEQTTGPRIAKFCMRMHFDKLRSHADFHKHRQRA